MGESRPPKRSALRGSAAYPYQILPGHGRGQDFATSTSFSKLRVLCPSWSNNVGSLKLSLYKSAPNFNYAVTVSTSPMAVQTFTNYVDNSWLEITFPNQEPGGTAFEDGVGTTAYDLLSEVY